MAQADAFGNPLSDGELVVEQLRALHGDLSETAAATGDYLQNISQKIDSIEESQRALHFGLTEAAERRSATLTQLTHIKWLLLVLLLVLFWRLF